MWWHQQLPTAQMVGLSNSLDTMAAMTKAGLGLALLPSDLQRPGIKRLFRAKAVDAGQLWIFTHPDLRNVVRIKIFSQFLLDYMRTHPAFAAAPANT